MNDNDRDAPAAVTPPQRTSAEILAILRPLLDHYAEASKALSKESAEENETGLSPRNETYWGRDDAAVQVADWCADLVQALEREGQA